MKVKVLSDGQLSDFLADIAVTREVRVPVRLADGTRSLGRFGDAPLALHGGALPGKPTAAFFPQEDMVFATEAGCVELSPVPAAPLFVAGFTRQDLACLRFIDRFFADGWRDDLYFRQREHAVVAGVTGYCGPAGSLLAPAGGDCDLEFIRDGAGWLVAAYTEEGAAITAVLPDTAPPGALEAVVGAAAALPAGDEQLLLRAAELLRTDRVPDSFWGEVADRCIACTGCNLACPTCTCFGVQDWRSAQRVERSRMWDSCQLDGFMREASGHNPLGTEALRTRRRIHHKLAADRVRWGEVSCFLCGRCDAVCPTGIGMLAVAREIVDRFGGA